MKLVWCYFYHVIYCTSNALPFMFSSDVLRFEKKKKKNHLICCIFLVVNCVQCHPFDCTIATSGIDSTIKVSIKMRISAPQIQDRSLGF